MKEYSSWQELKNYCIRKRTEYCRECPAKSVCITTDHFQDIFKRYQRKIKLKKLLDIEN